MTENILAPAAVLILWSLIMLVWMAVVRFAAFSKSGVDVKNAKPGGRGSDLEGVLPDRVMWKAHNYAHLMEQPTIFYAAVLILHAAGAATSMAISLAWAYTVLRIAHSLWQATVNTIIPVRFGLFLLATSCLLVLSVMAVAATL
ncbi:MAPEG family protein [Marinicaulis aureus]|uniref:MAPEG family protein n=1 Tax=Hyphococcus aureus TaxID=2666033 RepID=A0ABW1KWL0_9PROT